MSCLIENKKDLYLHHVKKCKVYSAGRAANTAFSGMGWKRGRKEREKEEEKYLIPTFDTA